MQVDIVEAREKLAKVRVLASLTSAAIERLALEVTWSKFEAGETIVAHRDRQHSVFFLIEGMCNARMIGPAGRVFPLRRLEAGGHFGEIAALTGAPRTLEIAAETAVVLAECPASAFKALMESEPKLATTVAQAMARTIISLTDRLFEFATLEVRYRLHAELLRLARGAEKIEDGLLIVQTPTQDALAAAIGSQRESVNRELSYLESEGVLSRRRDRKIVIRDVSKLRALAQGRAGPTVSQLLDWGDAS